MKKKIVWVQSPRAGLANKILVWANAFVFAEKHNLSMVTTNWITVFIGPILRKEKSKRFYSGYFNNDTFWRRIKVRTIAALSKKQINPKKNKLNNDARVIVFNQVIFWMHFFDEIRADRNLVKEHFFNTLLNKDILKKVNEMEAPEIGVHIRMGDFSSIKSEEKFKWNESTLERTPLNYFSVVINSIRKIVGKNIKVTIFSDGAKEELKEILEIENVHLIEGNRDIEDMILLSKSKVIVTSASSTFGLLAGYFSDAILIHHPDFYMRPVRDEETNKRYYEGPFINNENNLLKTGLQKINWNG